MKIFTNDKLINALWGMLTIAGGVAIGNYATKKFVA